MSNVMAIILFVTMIALSTTLVTGKVMAKAQVWCANGMCFDNSTNPVKNWVDNGTTIETATNMTSNTTALPASPTNDIAKSCNILQDTINSGDSIGADTGNSQRLHDDICN